jgi:hypothetical protein
MVRELQCITSAEIESAEYEIGGFTMSKKSGLQAILAAIVIAFGGVVVAAAGDHETIDIDVVKKDDNKVVIVIDGDKEVITLEDLEDGEVRTIDDGEHGTITVKRDGGRLKVSMEKSGDGGERVMTKTIQIHTGEGEEDHHMVWVAEPGNVKIEKFIAGEHGKVFGKEHNTIFVSTSDEEGTFNIMKLDDLDIEVDGEPIVVKLKKGAHGYAYSHGLSGEMHEHGGDRVAYQCPEDKTMLVIAKDKANQERYLCPACGTDMEKIEHKFEKVITVVETKVCDKEKK